MPQPHHNRLFDTKTLELLQDCRRWRLVSTLLTPGPETPSERQSSGPQRVPSHSHPFPEILLALKGNASYRVAGCGIRCVPGTALIIDDNVSHDFGYPPECQPFWHIWLRISGDHVFAKSVCEGYAAAHADPWGCLLPLAETGVDFWRLWGDCHATADLALRRLRLQTILGGILSRLIEEGTRTSNASPDTLGKSIEAIIRYIEDGGGREFSLDEIAHLAGYSKYYFCRAFRERTGMVLHEFINRSRVRKVSSWLAEGRSRKEIAALLGFAGSASFSRWCRKHRNLIAVARNTSLVPEKDRIRNRA